MSVDRIKGQFGGADWMGDLARAFPKFAEGLARVGDVVTTDGAMTARDKQLSVAAIGAVKRNPRITTEALDGAFAGGLTTAEAWGAGINVLISRGIPAFETFVDAITMLRPDGAPVGDPFTDEVTTDDITEYYSNLLGTVPPNVVFGSKHAPLAVEGYYLMRQTALEESPLAPVLADLMLVAVNAAEYQADFVEIHARFALRRGATAAQLAEAAACSIPYAGVAAWLHGANGCIAALENS